jgi:hypothetical protein
MNRRKILQQAAALPLMPVFGKFAAAASAAGTPSGIPFKRCRPGDAAWPSPERWAQLNKKVGGQLIAVKSPLEACRTGAGERRMQHRRQRAQKSLLRRRSSRTHANIRLGRRLEFRAERVCRGG